MAFNRNIRDWAAAFLGTLLLLFACMVPAAAQTITNVATAQWKAEGRDFTATSSQIAIEVIRPAATIDTFHLDAGSSLSISPTLPSCRTDTGSLTVAGASAVAATPVSPATTFRIGELVVFRVDAPLANRDPSAIDTVTGVVTTTSGDREELTVAETGANTGVFVGAVPSAAVPMPPVANDCRLSAVDGDVVRIEARLGSGLPPIVTTTVAILADPYGLVFDSEDGAPVSGVRVTMVDAATGQPATVFADDGVTPWPSSVIAGQPITDAAGNIYPMAPGEYRFPLAPLGTYRLVIEPPAPYTAPSLATAAQLAGLARPDGGALAIAPGSYGQTFVLSTPSPVRLDIPLDRPNVAVGVTKTASRPRAVPGDAVIYTVTVQNRDTLRAKIGVTLADTPSRWLRLRSDSVRLDGIAAPDAVSVASDGRGLTVRFDRIEPGATRRLTYAMTVSADAPAGTAMNTATATDARGGSSTARATLTIDRETIASRMTLIGRVTEGDCLVEKDRRGIPGVRVMLEDGSFALTDADGRYHFEGLMPGTHVVQAQRQTLPEGGRFVDCSRTTANAGSATSRFVRGQGGSLAVADFHAVLPEGWQPLPAEAAAEAPLGDAAAAGGETDWLAIGDGPDDFLFPQADHNPRVAAVRVVIRHRASDKVELRTGGKPVGALAFDGSKRAPDGRYAVSIWRAVPLDGETTRLTARIVGADGTLVKESTRDVVYAAAPARVEIVPARSRLIADGATRPVVALRFIDRKGNPVRAGMTGSVAINAPYESAAALDAMQLRQLTGLGGASPTWTVEGDGGIALVELAPTMVSGPLHLEFGFADGELTRTQELDAWIVPGQQEWTLVGLAEGAIGSRSIADAMERSGRFDSNLGDHARAAFYAKGRVLGKFLITAAYDSAKQQAEERLTGAIDLNAYYSVYADGSLRRFDAASREKLYVRIETAAFYAIYGDIQTGFDSTDLARYVRAATGVKAEGRIGAAHLQAFAAKTETRQRRDEIQGNGLSGPYRLSSRAIVPNSEVVAIEVRDRFRSELVVSRRELERFVDYDIDLLSGTVSFKAPVLSRDFDLNPQFIVIDYETDTLTAAGEWNAGLRGDVTLANGAVRLGATAITDKGDGARTNLVAADARVRIGAASELRAEIAASRSAGDTSFGWQVEAGHHSGDVDVIAYARSLDAGFGVGQQNGAERGRRKAGVDARYRASEHLSFTASAWRDDSLTDAARRDAMQLQGTWRTRSTDLRVGVARFVDRFADGTRGASTVLEGGATQRLLDNRLELDASSSIALEGTDSIDLPTRHRLGARYALTSDVRLIGNYEVALGDAIDARTFQAGLELTPWVGARMSSSLGQQRISEYGKRSFAAFGLAQSIPVSPTLTLDATLDGNRQLGGVDAGKVINPLYPVASGGHLGQDGMLFEDFTAATFGATWRKDRWSATARGEWRDGQFANRKGATVGAIRQIGEGSIVGAGATWTRARSETGAFTEIVDAAISAAHRPTGERFAFLGKLEYRSDRIENAVAGDTDFAGRAALGFTGDATSRRLIASLSTNWSPRGYDMDDEGLANRTEVALFLGGRYNFDRVEDFDLAGFTALAGLDARVGIGDRLEIGARATVSSNVTDSATSVAVGPEIGFVPTRNVLLSVGYNVAGFRDADFSAARQTDKGLFAAVRMKFDADSFGFLGLGQ